MERKLARAPSQSRESILAACPLGEILTWNERYPTCQTRRKLVTLGTSERIVAPPKQTAVERNDELICQPLLFAAGGIGAGMQPTERLSNVRHVPSLFDTYRGLLFALLVRNLFLRALRSHLCIDIISPSMYRLLLGLRLRFSSYQSFAYQFVRLSLLEVIYVFIYSSYLCIRFLRFFASMDIHLGYTERFFSMLVAIRD